MALRSVSIQWISDHLAKCITRCRSAVEDRKRLFATARFLDDCDQEDRKLSKPPPSVCVEKIEGSKSIPDCPRPCPYPDLKMVPLVRLRKRPLKPKFLPLCHDGHCPDRADKNLVIKMKRLPVLRESQECMCVEPLPLKKYPCSFKRLKKRMVTQPMPDCLVSSCPPRADDGLKILEKVLPYIPPGNCKCVETTIRDVPPLKRLIKRPIPPPPPDYYPTCEPDACPVKKHVIESKRLPCMKPTRKKIINPKLKAVPLVRLKKRPVCPQPRIKPCLSEECPRRADEICKYKIKEKTLPTLLLCEKSNEMSIDDFKKTGKKRRKKKLPKC